MTNSTIERENAFQAASDAIQLSGVRVHNLKNIDLQIAYDRLTVICGVSGSGKSSLAFDTLFAEGQRRYVETFSPYVRQFLDRVERPDVDRIDGMPPAIAIRQNANTAGNFSTVGTRTEIYDSLRNLFAACGTLHCNNCSQPAQRMNSDSVTRLLIQDHADCRAMLVFRLTEDDQPVTQTDLQNALAEGYTRCIQHEATTTLEDVLNTSKPDSELLVVADRIKIQEASEERIRESIGATFAATGRTCEVIIDAFPDPTPFRMMTVDGRQWVRRTFHRGLQCVDCERSFGDPTAESLNFQSAAGACPKCEGTGQVSGMSFDKVVPDEQLSLEEGAIQPWTTPAYRHELDELLALAGPCGIPTDVPFAELTEEHRRLIHNGVPEYNFGGLVGFHRWLVRHRYKKGVSVVLNRWRSWLPCPDCHGQRLRQTGGTLKLNNQSIAELSACEVSEVQSWFEQVEHHLDSSTTDPNHLWNATQTVRTQLSNRLGYLVDCGLGYLSLDRSLKTLSGGEAQRVILTAALGSGLINTLYVLDEPTSGLHHEDSKKVLQAVRRLQQQGNTVVVVEHDPDFMAAADEVIEIGPAAGNDGGELVFQGSFPDLQNGVTVTGEALRATVCETHPEPHSIRKASSWLSVTGVNCHNIQQLEVELPLGLICAFTGVSGSGKSSLLVDAIYPALCRMKGQLPDREAQGTVHQIAGSEVLNEIRLLDQSPIRTSRRSIPATLLNCFDEIRKVLAATHEAKKRNFKPGMFSFNSSAGGRCEHCEGLGQVTVEMQFLADIQTTCEGCSGKRFRPDVLEVRYRDRNIDDILNMTIEQAFTFFHNQKKIQQKLNAMRQAGLGYLRLGQPVSTLSGGEAQRLRIAGLLAGVSFASDSDGNASRKASKSATGGTLFLLDEPSTGLHLKDVTLLMKCLNHLVDIGHTVWVIEHDQAVVKAADYVVELGPGPGKNGGKIVKSEASA